MDISAETIAKADRLEVLARRIGFTVLQVQALEGASAQYLVLCTKAKRGMEATAAQKIVEKARKETFGATIGAMNKAGLLSDELENRFKLLLKERNWLIHRCRSENSAALLSDEATSTLLERINGAEAEARKLLHEIQNLAHKFVLASGVSEEAVNAASAAELVRQWDANYAI